MVSSKDVAKRAGVSQTTVSRVLNTPEKVTDKTLEKVNKAMKELEYRPNLIARSLVKKKTHSIALLSGPLHNPFYVETTMSIVNYAKAHGFNVNVHFESNTDQLSVYEDVFKHQVDGIILSSILYEDPIYQELQQLNVPFIMFNRKHKEKGHYIEMDNAKAGRLATDHLLELNHRNIAWIGGPLVTSTFLARYTGYCEALENKGVPVRSENTVITDTGKAAVLEKTKELMARKNKPSAIFAATDSIAIYMMDWLLKNGYKIPEDVSIVSMDNVGWSHHHAFQLTTVGTVEQKNLGEIAIGHLIELIHQKERGESGPFIQQTLETRLFRRHTTKRKES
ncbi:LacI family DNA-binding transcriptional regulator [Planococcus salinus]|uniref:LacI family transcriptional regulator n=1 Tax=Planococcus salinus TaxID=1848460 RepID=A0A3M8P7Y9_9BACL|nr:LacI family DNA-binding transcriptional regulator [Planococcus salinus]RNF39541.1 LacI family transcriptional regulator [Planococcus salinus]